MIITTTGTLGTVTIIGLLDNNNSDLVITHPSTVNLLDSYDSEDLNEVSPAIQALIDAGHITVTSTDGDSIIDVATTTSSISDLESVAFTGDYNDLINTPATLPPGPHSHPQSDITGLVSDQATQDAAIALNTAKISATGTELVSSDIDTLVELNSIISDATLIDTGDPRLSDARTPTPHTHIESDVTDLDKYTQALVDSKDAAVKLSSDNHIADSGNPHTVTKAQVGLGNADNTSDLNKPVSTAQQTALDLKADKTISIIAGNSLSGGGDLSVDRTLNVKTSESIENSGLDNLHLVNDSLAPGNFMHYATDKAGVKGWVQRSPALLTQSGRFYLNSNTPRRWRGTSNPNYGPNYYQFNEYGGNGTEPIVEWENLGHAIPSGRHIKDLHWIGRVNNTQITDVEIRVLFVTPTGLANFQNGTNLDSEVAGTVLFSGNWKAAVGAFTGSMSHQHAATIPLNFDVTELGHLVVFVKPIGTPSATRYFYTTMTWEIY